MYSHFGASSTPVNSELFKLLSETERQHRLILLTFLLLSGAGCSCAPAKNYLDPQGPKFSGQYAGVPRLFDDTLKVVSFNIKFANRIGLARSVEIAKPSLDTERSLLRRLAALE